MNQEDHFKSTIQFIDSVLARVANMSQDQNILPKLEKVHEDLNENTVSLKEISLKLESISKKLDELLKVEEKSQLLIKIFNLLASLISLLIIIFGFFKS